MILFAFIHVYLTSEDRLNDLLVTVFFYFFIWTEKFKKIFFVTVSEKPNLDRIVQEMCLSSGSQVPTFQNEANALIWLQECLTKTGNDPLLLVLDDVWLDSSKSLLEKCREFKMSNYKILVTSRFRLPGFCSYYELNPLNDKDAMDLFLDTTSLRDSEFDIPTDLVTKVMSISICISNISAYLGLDHDFLLKVSLHMSKHVYFTIFNLQILIPLCFLMKI